ncbi:hypothetical protein V6Z12_A06G173000 [Gossypium hirsutum]
MIFCHLMLCMEKSALVEFNFQVSDLFLDFQDGVRLCRVIQLLRHDPSILMKIVVPSDTQKKNLANCGVALEYLKQAGVMLCDEDGLRITGDDVASGDKELTLSLLWNIFVHLQLPLLIDKTTIADEISKIGGFKMDSLNVINSTLMGILLNWIQAICGKYDLKIDSFSSLDNGKAIWCLLDYYFRRELSCSCSNKDSHEPRGEKSIMSATDYTDAVHNFILSQKLTTLLGNFPEVLQISDLLEHNGAVSDQSVVILLVFLLSQLIVKKNVDQLNFHKLLGCGCQSLERRHSLTQRQSASSDTVVHNKERDIDTTKDAAKKFKAIQAWWRNMTEQNYRSSVRSATSISNCSTAQKTSFDILRENAATIIQSHYRRLKERRNFLKMMKAICLVQTVVRTWLTIKKNTKINKFCSASGQEFRAELKRVATLIVERHNFVNLRKSVLLTQQPAKIYIAQRRDASCLDPVKAAIVIQKYVRGWMVRSYHILGHACTENASPKCQVKGLNNREIEAATRIQIAWKNFLHRSLHKRTYAATKIQSNCRGWRLRMRFMKQKQAITKIQSNFRRLKCWRAFQNAWKEFICRTLQNQSLAATRIQSHFRGWQLRRNFMKKKQAIIKIQSHFRGWQLRRNCMKKKQAIIKIQSNFRLQKCLRTYQQYKNPNSSAIIIQSFVRGWMARREARRYRYLVVMIQSHWKGYVARKESRGQLKDLRLRMVESAKNVDDSKRIINRLLSALSVLLSMKSISGILHHCETLDMATAHSQKCCEELVAAGAIGILLKQIRSASRSIPDQQVLKHALSTLRNLARYPHLAEVLIDTPPSVEIILWEMLRNKEEGYFIASEILKKICSNPKGVKAVHKFPALLKRLHTLVEELTRKLNTEKRNPRTVVLKENTDRRLKKAVQLLRLITNGYRIQ